MNKTIENKIDRIIEEAHKSFDKVIKPVANNTTTRSTHKHKLEQYEANKKDRSTRARELNILRKEGNSHISAAKDSIRRDADAKFLPGRMDKNRLMYGKIYKKIAQKENDKRDVSKTLLTSDHADRAFEIARRLSK